MRSTETTSLASLHYRIVNAPSFFLVATLVDEINLSKMYHSGNTQRCHARDLSLGGDRYGDDYVLKTARCVNDIIAYRFFGPKVGIGEDPVTGSAHCLLAPYTRRSGTNTPP